MSKELNRCIVCHGVLKEKEERSSDPENPFTHGTGTYYCTRCGIKYEFEPPLKEDLEFLP